VIDYFLLWKEFDIRAVPSLIHIFEKKVQSPLRKWRLYEGRLDAGSAAQWITRVSSLWPRLHATALTLALVLTLALTLTLTLILILTLLSLAKATRRHGFSLNTELRHGPGARLPL